MNLTAIDICFLIATIGMHIIIGQYFKELEIILKARNNALKERLKK